MPTKTKKQKTEKTRQLDEKMAAYVIAEYMGAGKVTEADIKKVTEYAGPVNPREVAIAFRVSEVLGVRDPFRMPPRFRLAFERAREYFKILKTVEEHAAEERAS